MLYGLWINRSQVEVQCMDMIQNVALHSRLYCAEFFYGRFIGVYINMSINILLSEKISVVIFLSFNMNNYKCRKPFTIAIFRAISFQEQFHLLGNTINALLFFESQPN
jgi:hypothetical protein